MFYFTCNHGLTASISCVDYRVYEKKSFSYSHRLLANPLAILTERRVLIQRWSFGVYDGELIPSYQLLGQSYLNIRASTATAPRLVRCSQRPGLDSRRMLLLHKQFETVKI